MSSESYEQNTLSYAYVSSVVPVLTITSFEFCIQITRFTSGVVHSFAFIGRTRTATVKLLTSLAASLDPLLLSEQSALFRYDCGVSSPFLFVFFGVCASITTLLKQSGVDVRCVDAKRSPPLPVGVEKSNNRFATELLVKPFPKRFLFVEFDAPGKLCVDEVNVLDVVSFDFVDPNFVLPVNGEAVAAENPVFKISFCVNRNRSRKSHAETCLISVGRAPADNFLVVLNVARTGFIGVVVLDGVEHFTVDELVGFEIFALGVYFEDILF